MDWLCCRLVSNFRKRRRELQSQSRTQLEPTDEADRRWISSSETSTLPHLSFNYRIDFLFLDLYFSSDLARRKLVSTFLSFAIQRSWIANNCKDFSTRSSTNSDWMFDIKIDFWLLWHELFVNLGKLLKSILLTAAILQCKLRCHFGRMYCSNLSGNFPQAPNLARYFF